MRLMRPAVVHGSASHNRSSAGGLLRRPGLPSWLLVVTLVIGSVDAPQAWAGPVSVSRAVESAATVTTGTAGVFVPLQGRIVDTRHGTGNPYTTPMPAGVWRKVQVDGLVGIPASGVSAVQVNVTVVNPSAEGTVEVGATSSTQRLTTALVYNAGVSGSVSATTIVAVASDGTIQAMTETTENLLIDVQGYYTSGNGAPAPGGYVPVMPTRVVDTRNGTGTPIAKLSTNTTYQFQVGGHGGVPVGASAVFAELTPISYTATAGYFIPFPSGTSWPAVSLNYPGNMATSIGAAVDLAPDGSFKVRVGGDGAAIDFLVDIQGYYTAAAGTAGAFTPAATRAYDSRVPPRTAIAAGVTATIPLAGVAGIPAAGSSVSAVAINVQAITAGSSTGGGWVKLWADDQAEPVPATVNMPTGQSIRENMAVIQPGADGQVKVRNNTGGPLNLVLDVVGWYSNATPAIQNGQTTTAQRVTLQAGPGGGAFVTYQYRSGMTNAFSSVPVTNVTVPGTITHPAAWPVGKNGSGKFDPYTWDVAATVGITDQLVQVQACYGASSTDTNPVCSMPSNVQLGADGFQNAYATTDLAPGILSELTGDFKLSQSDVNEASYQGSMAIARIFTTLAPSGERIGAAGVFGPGWTADLASSDGVGEADLTVADHTANGYLTFTGADGSTSIYQAATSSGAYPTSFAGVGDAAADDATVTMTSASMITMTDADGTVTTWTKTGSAWAATTVAQTGSASTTTYTYNASGLPSRLLGAVPNGLSCANPDTTTGCRSLTFSYTTITVGGIAKTRLAGMNLVAYNPATSAMATTAIAAYSYDANGRLAAQWDPRVTPNLRTSYTYNSAGRLATLTPPGLEAWTLGYDSAGRLSTASRPDPSGSTATTTVVYGVPFTGTGAPVDVGATAAATWGQQSDLATTGTAIFGPNRTPAGTTATTVESADWPWASIDYLDVNGRTVNSAGYGAGAWQTDATQYDADGNAIWNLTAGNRAQALTTTADTDPAAAALSSTWDRTNLLASTSAFDPLHPGNLTDTLGPIHPITLSDNSIVDARTHNATAYDQGAPADGATYNLPSTQTQSAQTLDGIDHETQTTLLGYSAIRSGDPTGWSLRMPTTKTVQMGPLPSPADLTTTTRYNATGQVITSILPGSTGSDARTTSTTYFSATGSGPCVSAAFAGLKCQVGPAAQPTTGNPLPVTTTSYTMDNQISTSTAVAGTTTRTSTTSYDASGRITGAAITVTPAAAGGTPVSAITNTYSPDTGLQTTSSAGGQTLTTGYDSLGRVISYTDATGNLATTGYDISGRVASVNDGKGTTAYTYDTTSEHRGAVTGEDVGAGSAPLVFTASYTPDGTLAEQIYPNGIVAAHRYDNTGAALALSYTQGDATLLSYTAGMNAHSRTASMSGGGIVDRYSYDADGRLITVQDTVAGSGSTAACTTRVYGFDKGSNRTALNAYPDGSGGTASGNCSTATTPDTTPASYDQADRLTSIGYSLDTLGRTTTVPAADARGAGTAATISGVLTLGYYTNDMVASQSQGSATRSYTLDPEQDRISTVDDTTTTTTNHYNASTDAPSWTGGLPDATPEQVPANATWTRNLLGVDGLLAGSQTNSGTVIWQLTDPQGSVVATVPDYTGAATITAGTSFTEYGSPRDPTKVSTYGWLSSHRRSADTLGGLILMGVRLYNPSTGRFLSTDPVPGGSANPYLYPTDPINAYDLNGQWWSWLRSSVHAVGHAYSWTSRHVGRAGRWIGRRASEAWAWSSVRARDGYHAARHWARNLYHAHWFRAASGLGAATACVSTARSWRSSSVWQRISGTGTCVLGLAWALK
jgi:RHS repeat-associated protein